jgi:exodeoxyribonuclease VII large subunit
MGMISDDSLIESPPSDRVWTVSQVTNLIKGLFDNDPDLRRVTVQGEVTNLSKSSAGHIYFSLKDSESTLRCVAFRGSAERLKVQPENNREIIAKGRISVWQQGGSYQLYIDSVEDVGVGALWIEFEETRKRLQSEGLFSDDLKRPLPEFPKNIGLVTSPDGAALRDMLRIFSQHAPYISCVLSPSLVQGETAPPSLIAALDKLEMWNEMVVGSGEDGIDLIIIGRGGGSFEDLACFNNEKLVRRIRDCKVPVISAVGHEVDFTISDFVADVRAATPTQAASIAAPDIYDLHENLYGLLSNIRVRVEARYKNCLGQLDNTVSRTVFTRPKDKIHARMQDVDFLQGRLRREITVRLSKLKKDVETSTARISSLDPQAILNRGYSLAFNSETGKLISRVSQASPGAQVDLKLSDGNIKLTVDGE